MLPEIRKTGFFGAIEIKDQISISKQIAVLAAQITDTKNAFQRRRATWSVSRCRRLTGSL
ncbi:MAG: hypothetical protein ACXWTH_06095 [Methylosarcina sp.]